MSANVETMFYVRETPWHGLGTEIREAPASADALIAAGLDWIVEQRDVYSEDGSLIPGYKVNIRSTDQAALGIVSDHYKVVQNKDAFQFTDDLLGEGVTYETAGSLQGGKKVWMLARIPQRYIIAGDEITPYMVMMNSHDGSSGIKVAMTPIRVVCQNTLNLALNTAKRIWAAKHTENVMNRVCEARDTLLQAETYMAELGRGIDELSKIKLSDRKILEMMQELFPVSEDINEMQKKNNLRLLEDLKQRYWDAPDLSHVGKNGYRFINAVSDFATHKLANIRIVSEYIHANFLSRGLCAVAAIHAGINQTDPARNNPHVHMIVSTRAVNEEGFCPKKDRELDRSENMEIWREQWEQVQNRAYARNGLPIRVSHESLEMQGKHDWEPTIHLSRIDWQREKNGERTANGNKKREIQARNEARQRQFCQMENREIDITR